MKLHQTIAICFLFIAGSSNAQDFQWWNEKHDWDGITPWQQYIELSPSLMGPNALPVPQAKNGVIDTCLSLQVAADLHFSQGDETQNLFTRVFIPLPGKKAALEFHVVPYEQFSMDTLTRDERKARDRDGTGTSGGDIYIGTQVQLLNASEHGIDALMSVNLRTASGTNLGAARHTETPGYYFDLSLGKEFKPGASGKWKIRPFALGGFYVWQTRRNDHYQNDAFLFGLGCRSTWGKACLGAEVSGYLGYIGNGDKPVVARMSGSYSLSNQLEAVIQTQLGLNDWVYSGIRIGLIAKWPDRASKRL